MICVKIIAICVKKINLVAWRPFGLPQGWRPEAAASTAYRSYATALKVLFAPLTSCFSTHQNSKLLLRLAPSLMLLLQYGTLYLLTYVILHLFIHSPLISKPTFSYPSSFAHSY